MTDRLVHIDEPTWFDAETGDVTHALARETMTVEEREQLELTGMFDPKFLVCIPQDDRDGSMYAPDLVAMLKTILEEYESVEAPGTTTDEKLAWLRARRARLTQP